MSAPTILDRIVADMRREVASRKKRAPMESVRERALNMPPARDFRAAITARGLSLVAEFKRASPSKGPIHPDADPAAIARAYESAGARAMSVLTNGPFFGGSDGDLHSAREAVSLPVLRKDFTVDPYQIQEARALGADAVLLIVAALSDDDLAGLLATAHDAGLAALVETHDAAEIDRALAAGADIIGINNRDLRTFATAIETTERLRDRVPLGVPVVSESGIFARADTERLARIGVDAVLVGESLMRCAAADPATLGALVRDLVKV